MAFDLLIKNGRELWTARGQPSYHGDVAVQRCWTIVEVGKVSRSRRPHDRRKPCGFPASSTTTRTTTPRSPGIPSAPLPAITALRASSWVTAGWRSLRPARRTTTRWRRCCRASKPFRSRPCAQAFGGPGRAFLSTSMPSTMVWALNAAVMIGHSADAAVGHGR